MTDNFVKLVKHFLRDGRIILLNYFLVIMLIFLVVFGYNYFKIIVFGEKTTATVVSINENNVGKTGFRKIEFLNTEGTKIVKNDLFSTRNHRVSVGDKITIYYDIANNENVLDDGDKSLLAIISINIFTILAIWVFLLVIWRKKEKI